MGVSKLLPEEPLAILPHAALVRELQRDRRQVVPVELATELPGRVRGLHERHQLLAEETLTPLAAAGLLLAS